MTLLHSGNIIYLFFIYNISIVVSYLIFIHSHSTWQDQGVIVFSDRSPSVGKGPVDVEIASTWRTESLASVVLFTTLECWRILPLRIALPELVLLVTYCNFDLVLYLHVFSWAKITAHESHWSFGSSEFEDLEILPIPLKFSHSNNGHGINW